MDRAEHLQWCKDRALVYVDEGALEQAVLSLTSDLAKHPDTSSSFKGLESIAIMSLQEGPDSVRGFINGFN